MLQLRTTQDVCVACIEVKTCTSATNVLSVCAGVQMLGKRNLCGKVTANEAHKLLLLLLLLLLAWHTVALL